MLEATFMPAAADIIGRLINTERARMFELVHSIPQEAQSHRLPPGPFLVIKHASSPESGLDATSPPRIAERQVPSC